MVRLLLADIQEIVPLLFKQRQPLSEGSIRLLSSLMRRWLVDGDLKKLLAPLRTDATFDVQGNAAAVEYQERTGAYRYLLTGGIMLDGRPIRFIGDSPLGPHEVDRSFMTEARATLPLKRFLSQPRLLHDGQWFTTADILRFVANKLGGNHVDFDRTGQWASLDKANRYMAFGGPALAEPPDGSDIYLRVEPSSEEVLGGAHLETVAAAASFVQLSIDGVQLCTVKSERSFVARLRDLLMKRPGVTMVERSGSASEE